MSRIYLHEDEKYYYFNELGILSKLFLEKIICVAYDIFDNQPDSADKNSGLFNGLNIFLLRQYSITYF